MTLKSIAELKERLDLQHTRKQTTGHDKYIIYKFYLIDMSTNVSAAYPDKAVDSVH